MLNQRLMVTAVIKKNKKYLLLKRSKKNKMYHSQWQFPEGGVKFGESPLQALKRELKEETNLEIEDAKYLGAVSSVLKEFNIKVWHFVRIAYRCKVKDNIGELSNQKLQNNISRLTNHKLNQAQSLQKLKEVRKNTKAAGKIKIKLSKKHSEFGWFTKKQIEELKLIKGFKFEDIKRYL